MGRTVSSPDGNRWYVRRVWLPWKPRWRKPNNLPDIPLDAAPGCADDLAAGAVAVVAAVVIGIVLFVVVVPVLVTLVEVAFVLLLAALSGFARIALRRPWIVEATPATGTGRFRWQVVGWRRSGEVVDEVARQLAAGRRELLLPDVTPC